MNPKEKVEERERLANKNYLLAYGSNWKDNFILPVVYASC